MRTILVTLVALLGLGAAGCGGGGGGGSALDVVASTNVYGDLAAQIGGSHVHVTSVLTNPDADPHLFEPGTQNGLAVAEARLAIQNGAGYDDFMGKLEAASPSKSRIVVTIADVLDVHGRDANPHVWYDVPRLPRIASLYERDAGQLEELTETRHLLGLGLGDAGEAAAQQLHEHDRVELGLVVEDEQARARVIGEFNVPHAFADSHELLALPELDAAVIRVPADRPTIQQAISAASNGRRHSTGPSSTSSRR